MTRAGAPTVVLRRAVARRDRRRGPAIRTNFSLVAERAVRYLDGRKGPASSREVVRAVLASEIGDEKTAKRILEAAFSGDDRLEYRHGGWSAGKSRGGRRGSIAGAGSHPVEGTEPSETDRALVLLDGERPSVRGPFALRSVAVIRLVGERVVNACAGDVGRSRSDPGLRDAVRETLEGAIPVVHDEPGALSALERWLDEPLETPLSLRRLGRLRFGLPSRHDLEALAARMGLPWRDGGDIIARAEILDTCLQAMRRPGEAIEHLRAASSGGAPPIPWSRYEFDRSFLRTIPSAPGTYRFYDARGAILYVGKSANLRRRVASYFLEGGERSARVQRLVEALRRIDVEPSGSDLEAVLREAAAIARSKPPGNVQRRFHARPGRASRLRSILILEPAAPPSIVLVYLVRDGRLIDRVPLGPRSGGLRRVERLLETHFFDPRPGPESSASTDIDVELLARWLAIHRDRVVAFDPTHHKSSREVVARLRWFLNGGPLRDPDGTPIRYV